MEAQDVDNRIKTRSKEQNQKDVTLIDYYRYLVIINSLKDS